MKGNLAYVAGGFFVGVTLTGVYLVMLRLSFAGAELGSLTTVATVLLLGLAVLLSVAVWIYSLVEALILPESAWEEAGQPRLVYILLLVLLGVVGALLYLSIPRGAVRRAAKAASLPNSGKARLQLPA